MVRLLECFKLFVIMGTFSNFSSPEEQEEEEEEEQKQEQDEAPHGRRRFVASSSVSIKAMIQLKGGHSSRRKLELLGLPALVVLLPKAPELREPSTPASGTCLPRRLSGTKPYCERNSASHMALARQASVKHIYRLSVKVPGTAMRLEQILENTSHWEEGRGCARG